MDNQTVDGSEGKFEDRQTEHRGPENQTGHCHVPVQVQAEAVLPVNHSDNHHNVSQAATKRISVCVSSWGENSKYIRKRVGRTTVRHCTAVSRCVVDIL